MTLQLPLTLRIAFVISLYFVFITLVIVVLVAFIMKQLTILLRSLLLVKVFYTKGINKVSINNRMCN